MPINVFIVHGSDAKCQCAVSQTATGIPLQLAPPLGAACKFRCASVRYLLHASQYWESQGRESNPSIPLCRRAHSRSAILAQCFSQYGCI